MEYQNLGKTDQRISRIGLGCWAFGGHGWGPVNDDDSVRTIRKAYEEGVNFFDTADVYGFGHSEEILFAALGQDIKKVVIATKYGIRWDESGQTKRDISPTYTREAITASLKRLGLDCIPLYQIHWPDGLTPLDDTLYELMRLREEGKLQWIGVSNFSAPLIREAQDITRVESSQFEYNLISRAAEADSLPVCLDYQMSGLTYGSIAKGLLSAKFSPASKFPENDIRSRDKSFQEPQFTRNIQLATQIAQIGEKYGKSASQVAIRWLLQQRGVTCAIIGAKHPHQVGNNLGAIGWNLSSADMSDISNFSRYALPSIV